MTPLRVRQIEEKVNSIIDQSLPQEKAQDDIDALVYKLYGLDSEEIAIIEG